MIRLINSVNDENLGVFLQSDVIGRWLFSLPHSDQLNVCLAVYGTELVFCTGMRRPRAGLDGCGKSRPEII
jgi:hypothetical protein